MAVVGTWDSLAQAQKLVTDRLLAGVIEETIEEGHLVPRLPVMQLDAKSLIYNRESALPTAQFYDINEELSSAAPLTYDEVTATLKRCIGQWDLDRFIIRTYRDPNDMEATAVQQCRKGVGRFVEDKLIYGDNSADAKEFSGLHVLVASAQVVDNHATGAALSLAKVDEMIDLVKPGGPDLLLMNFQLKRRFDALMRVQSSYSQPIYVAPASLEAGRIGQPVTYYKGIPIVRTDFLTQTEAMSGGTYSAKTGGATCSIFGLKLGVVSTGGVCLVTGNPMFEFERIEPLEKKDAVRFRLIWYLTLANGSTRSIARVDGITDAEITV